MSTKLAYFLLFLSILLFPTFSMEIESNEKTFQMKEQDEQDSQQHKHVKFEEERQNPLEKRHNFSRGVQVLQRTKREQSATYESSPKDALLLKSKRKNQKTVEKILPFLFIDNFGGKNVPERQTQEENLPIEQEKLSVAESTKEQVLTAVDKNIYPKIGNVHQREKEKEMKMVEKQLSKVKNNKLLNLYPNDSSVQMYRDTQADKTVWYDPKNLIQTEIKEEIEFSFKQKEEKMSNCLFECISNWVDVPVEAYPFLKELMLPMTDYVDVQKKDKFNQTPLMFAATFDAKMAVVKLIERCAKLDVTDESGWTALHFAAKMGSELSCKVLLEKGRASVNVRTDLEKITPLMFASKHGHAGLVTQLLFSGADTKVEDKYFLTASYYANRKCRKVILEYETNKSKI